MVARLEGRQASEASPTVRLVERVLGGEAVRDDLQELLLNGGEVGFVSVSGTPIFGEQGQVDLAVLVYRDLSESRRAEEALRKSEEKYRSLFKYANDYIFIVDPSNGRFLDVYDKAMEKLGYSYEELLQMTIYDLDTPERRDGSGYPSGLKGEDILLEAKILAVADVVEAMASHRPYRPALGMEKALEEMTRNSGALYNAEAVAACQKLFAERRFEFTGREEAQCATL